MKQGDASTSWDQIVALERKTSLFSLEVFILILIIIYLGNFIFKT